MRTSRYTVIVPIAESEYLFVNTFTGAVAQGGKEVYQLLKGERNNCDEETISSLVSTGFLTELTPHEEIEYALEKLESIRQFIEGNLFFVLILTYACNMRCDYCFESYVFKKDPVWLQQKMSTNQVDAAFTVMEALNPDARVPVHLFGGEPLMYDNYDLVKYVLEKGEKLKKSFIIVTNGLEVDKFYPLLIKSDITSFQITLDGVQKIHDKRKKTLDKTSSFKRIVKGIDLLLDAGMQVYIRVVFDHSTVRTLPALMEFIKEKGWEKETMSVYITPARHHTEGGCSNFLCNLEEEDLEFLINEDSLQDAFWDGLQPLRQKSGLGIESWCPQIVYCRQTPSQMWLDPFGDIYLCTDSLGDKEHAVGTFYPELTFNDLFYQWKKRTIFDMKSCRYCRYAMICGGGCAHYAYHEKGGLLNSDCTFPQQAKRVYYPLIWKMLQKMKK